MKKIIIDCDPGHDDAVALLLATRSKELDILGAVSYTHLDVYKRQPCDGRNGGVYQP